MNARVCDKCQQPIDAGTGIVFQESIFVREARPNAHADGETTAYDLHDACADAFAGDRRTGFLARFRAGVAAVKKAEPSA